MNDKKLKCPHCSLNIYFESYDESSWKMNDNKKAWEEIIDGKTEVIYNIYGIAYGHCPSCDELLVFYREGENRTWVSKKGEPNSYENWLKEDIIFPKYTARNVEKEVPNRYKKDFLEASAVLNISPKASAAMSRRILQDVLREELGINKPSLAQEIDEFIKRTDVPSYLTDAVDAIRNIGNFAAHPLKDTNTGTIVEVEAGEAEWLLEVNESLFDFVFVQPKRLEARKNSLNAKLASLGKPPMKT